MGGGGSCRGEGGGVRLRGWGQGRSERRSEVFVKIQKTFFIFFGGGGGRVGGGQGGCERRKKKMGGGGRVGGSGWGVSVDVNGEVKFL